MMAPAQSNGPTDGRFPSAATLALLRAALGTYLRSRQSADDEAAVCEALEELAREAQERHLHGEHVLLALKEVWHDMTEVAAIGDRRERQRLLGRLVTLCIDVYYRRG